jgi:DNA-binding response OmpR family regulator
MTKRILVIDDESGIRKSFMTALEDTGYLVETAESGEVGIEKLEKQKYDLIYLDLNMPGLNGVETLRELRERDKDVPVYILTAFHAAFTDQLKKAADDKIDFELLKKPLSSNQVVSITRGILDGATII